MVFRAKCLRQRSFDLTLLHYIYESQEPCSPLWITFCPSSCNWGNVVLYTWDMWLTECTHCTHVHCVCACVHCVVFECDCGIIWKEWNREWACYRFQVGFFCRSCILCERPRSSTQMQESISCRYLTAVVPQLDVSPLADGTDSTALGCGSSLSVEPKHDGKELKEACYSLSEREREREREWGRERETERGWERERGDQIGWPQRFWFPPHFLRLSFSSFSCNLLLRDVYEPIVAWMACFRVFGPCDICIFIISGTAVVDLPRCLGPFSVCDTALAHFQLLLSAAGLIKDFPVDRGAEL